MKTTFITLCLLSSFLCNAQFGIELGLTNSKGCYYIFNQRCAETTEWNQFLQGLKVGVTYEGKITDKLSLHTGAFYSQKGSASDEIEEQLRFHYLQIPLSLSYKFYQDSNVSFTFSGGLYYGYMLSGQLRSGNTSTDIEFASRGYRREDIGMQSNIKMHLKEFYLGVEFENGFTPLYNRQTGDFRNAGLNLIAGYKF